MALGKGLVRRISRQVYRQFPELAGAEPKVQAQHMPNRSALVRADGGRKQPKAVSNQAGELYLLTFNGQMQLPDGRFLVRVVRVTANGRGKVLKITTSR